MSFTPRLTAPTDFNDYYTERRMPPNPAGSETLWQYFYSGNYVYPGDPEYPYGAHTGNCTWYAMGRSAEIAGRNLYNQFAGSYEAQDWNTIWTGHPAQTSGAIAWQPGDILVYSNAGGTAGHVEIVEQIIGNKLTISYSAYSSYTPQSDYATFFNIRYRNKPIFGDTASDLNDPTSRFTRNNGAKWYMTDENLIGVIHNPYYVPSTKAWLIARALQKRKKRYNVLFR